VGAANGLADLQGVKYLIFSPLIPSKPEKCISFAQFEYFLSEVCLLFNF
jgi:hypothetical protein